MLPGKGSEEWGEAQSVAQTGILGKIWQSSRTEFSTRQAPRWGTANLNHFARSPYPREPRRRSAGDRRTFPASSRQTPAKIIEQCSQNHPRRIPGTSRIDQGGLRRLPKRRKCLRSLKSVKKCPNKIYWLRRHSTDREFSRVVLSTSTSNFEIENGRKSRIQSKRTSDSNSPHRDLQVDKVSAQTDATSPCFHLFFNFLVCNIFVFRCPFFARNQSKIKESGQTDIIFKISASRYIGWQKFEPKRTEPAQIFNRFSISLLGPHRGYDGARAP